MKTVFLLRHAKSGWKDAKLSDIDRPLNKRGKEAAPEMAQKIKMAGILPDLIVSSPAKRAYKTASIIAPAIGYQEQNIKIEMDLYGANPEEIDQIVRSMEPGLDSVMLVGHNPGFTQALAYYTSTDLDNLPTCGLLQIDFPVEEWKEIGPQKGEFKLKLKPSRKTQ